MREPKELSFGEVRQYAEGSVRYFLSQHATRLSRELREEIFQDAMLRVWSAFQRLDPGMGWKSFVQLHCRGAVLDYIKSGKGHSEHFVPERSSENASPFFSSASAAEGAAVSAYELDGDREQYSDALLLKGFKPHWELLCRMAGVDDDLQIVCKTLLGFTQQEIADQFLNDEGRRVSRERISQKFHAFFEKLDSPEYYSDPWINQCIYALGLSEHYHQAAGDNGEGWNLPVMDLLDSKSFVNLRVGKNSAYAGEAVRKDTKGRDSNRRKKSDEKSCPS